MPPLARPQGVGRPAPPRSPPRAPRTSMSNCRPGRTSSRSRTASSRQARRWR
jgi:hypothetical protein